MFLCARNMTCWHVPTLNSHGLNSDTVFGMWEYLPIPEVKGRRWD